MFCGAQVYQVARSVANGDGDWSEVPRCVREAIVLALAKGEAASPSLDGVARASSLPQAYFDPSSSLPPVLTDGVVQRSIRTFEDAEWMRDEAVRSFAQLHNTIETLHATMTSQLSPVLRTAMQLHPDVLAGVKEEFNFTRRDPIPDGVALRETDVACITHQEYILDEMATSLRELRDRSVTFAANFLTDKEKLAMGANPAYLRPDTREEMQRRHTRATKPRTTPHKSATPEKQTHLEKRAHTAKAPKRVSIQEPGPEADSPSRFRHDAYLCELRERYMLRLAQLGEAEGAQAEKQPATSSTSRRQRHAQPVRRHSHDDHQAHRRIPVSPPEDDSSALSSHSGSYSSSPSEDRSSDSDSVRSSDSGY